MDLEDWELLTPKSYNGLDRDLGCGEDQESMNIIRNTRKSLDMNYFTCSTQDSFQETELHQESSVVPTQESSQEVPITWEPLSTVDATDHQNNPDPDLSDPYPELLADSVPSPRIGIPEKFTSAMPQSEGKHSDSDGGLGGERFVEMGSEIDEGEGEGGGDLRSKKEVDWDGDDEKMNLWKIGLNGIGTICSFGLAATAATICVFFLGHNNNNNNNSIQGCRKKNQILRLQIYSDDDKRMKEVGKCRATKLNEALTVMKSLPVARAQITFGGYYDGL